MSVRFQLSVSVAFSSHARDTGKRLPGSSAGPPRSVWAVGCLLMFAVSRRRCARLHDETRLEIQASFRSHDLSMRAICLLHSPSQITADYYHTRYRRRYAYRYIVFADTLVQ